MKDIHAVLAENIHTFRKKRGLTQEEIAERLGISSQSVSKWERAEAVPNCLLLPALADIFDCYIDELFSRQVSREFYLCSQFPWPDDDSIRNVVCKGRKIIKVNGKCIAVHDEDK